MVDSAIKNRAMGICAVRMGYTEAPNRQAFELIFDRLPEETQEYFFSIARERRRQYLADAEPLSNQQEGV